jgi:hypothetical protein
MDPNGKRFQIALSFPGEQRAYVAQVAEHLANEIGRERLLYDQYHEAEFARPNLDSHLQGLYHDQSELIAVFLCADYERKEWCGLEWRALRDLIKRRRDAEIMPLRFDATEVAGLFSTDGYVWIGDGRSPTEVADLILQRWRQETGQQPKPPQPVIPLIPAGLEQLRIYGQGFAGRQAELAHLDRAWDGHRMRVLVLQAPGGAGKTRLLAHWLDRLAERDYAGAGAVFIHSFYSQGSDERRNASSEVFFERALTHFGYAGPPILDAEQKARRLTALLLERRGLLVLDGLEPLQHPPAFAQGRLKDPAIERLLLALAGAAAPGPGLCLVVSRQPVVELEHHRGPRVDQRPLQRLDPAAGRALLRQLGVTGADAELEAAVDELRGHAYSLMLLGRYLAEATEDADIRRRHEISLLEQDAADGDHARHLFAAYLAHLGPEGPEAALLHLLGFFDRPAELGLMEALWGPAPADADPAEPGTAELARLAAPLAGLAPGGRRRLLGRLRGGGEAGGGDFGMGAEGEAIFADHRPGPAHPGPGRPLSGPARPRSGPPEPGGCRGAAPGRAGGAAPCR